MYAKTRYLLACEVSGNQYVADAHTPLNSAKEFQESDLLHYQQKTVRCYRNTDNFVRMIYLIFGKLQFNLPI